MTTTSNVKTHDQTGNWSEQKTQLKAKFPILKDADLHYENGKKEEMMTKLEKKLGKSKEELTQILSKMH